MLSLFTFEDPTYRNSIDNSDGHGVFNEQDHNQCELTTHNTKNEGVSVVPLINKLNEVNVKPFVEGKTKGNF